jgi:hypothetical protein
VEYARLRKQAVLEGIHMESLIVPYSMVANIQRRPLKASEAGDVTLMQETRKRAKSELEVLDAMIQSGYETILTMQEQGKTVPLTVLLDAIKLKNTITEGAHMGLTDYGIEKLKEMERGKFDAVMGKVLEMFPPEKYNELIDVIETAEEAYYRDTEYFEEFVRARGFMDGE